MTIQTIEATSQGIALTDTVRSLADWAADLEAAHRIGTALAPTQIVPDGLRGKPDDCAAVVLVGASLGLSPTTALQSMHVVNGRVGMSTSLMVAIVRREGHDIWTEEETPERATVAGRRKGWPAERVERVTITLEQAKQAGWHKPGKDGKRSPWDNPSDMLYYRAASRVCKKIAPEALHGVPSADDADDLPPITVEATVTKPTLAGITGKTNEATQAKPKANARKDDPLIPLREQLRQAIVGSGREGGEVTQRWISETIGRTVASPADMTAPEIRKVLAALEAEAKEAELSDAEVDESMTYDGQS